MLPLWKNSYKEALMTDTINIEELQGKLANIHWILDYNSLFSKRKTQNSCSFSHRKS